MDAATRASWPETCEWRSRRPMIRSRSSGTAVPTQNLGIASRLPVCTCYFQTSFVLIPNFAETGGRWFQMRGNHFMCTSFIVVDLNCDIGPSKSRGALEIELRWPRPGSTLVRPIDSTMPRSAVCSCLIIASRYCRNSDYSNKYCSGFGWSLLRMI